MKQKEPVIAQKKEVQHGRNCCEGAKAQSKVTQ
jgi:hypothetical protein